jgi:hypothetical protein
MESHAFTVVKQHYSQPKRLRECALTGEVRKRMKKIDHVYRDGTFYCKACAYGVTLEIANWEFEIEKHWEDSDDHPVPVYVRFIWKCPVCGEELIKTVSLGYAA